MPDAPERNELEKKYRTWLETHASVFALFERFALQMLSSKRRFSVYALTERVRWEIRTTWAPDADGFKINNNHRPYIARDLIAKYPALDALIETRTIHEDDEDTGKFKASDFNWDAIARDDEEEP